MNLFGSAEARRLNRCGARLAGAQSLNCVDVVLLPCRINFSFRKQVQLILAGGLAWVLYLWFLLMV